LIEGQSLADETGADGAKDISDQEEPLEVRVGALRETEQLSDQAAVKHPITAPPPIAVRYTISGVF
jgi:hypothetical protein